MRLSSLATNLEPRLSEASMEVGSGSVGLRLA